MTTTRHESPMVYNGVTCHYARTTTREGFGAATREVTRTDYYLDNADGPYMGTTVRYAKRDGSGTSWTTRSQNAPSAPGGRVTGVNPGFIVEGW